MLLNKFNKEKQKNNMFQIEHSIDYKQILICFVRVKIEQNDNEFKLIRKENRNTIRINVKHFLKNRWVQESSQGSQL